jgi:hypothetical protein
MRIPHQHPDASVTADGSDLWCGQIHRKEAADGLVTQIVKMDVGTVRRLAPSQASLGASRPKEERL